MLGFAPAIPSRSDLDWCWYLRRQGCEGEALERVLHDIGVMNPTGWADWAPSTMTATGAPVAMRFATDARGMSLRTEVADPASDPACRLSQVCRAMTELGGTPPGKGLRDVLSAAQGAGDLRYGAWLGLCQRGDILQTQLFAELPVEAQDLAGLIWPPDLCRIIADCAPDAKATMLGYDATTGNLELYFTGCHPATGQLQKIAGIAGVSDVVLARAIASLADSPETDTLPVPQIGFSLALRPKSKPVLAVFVQATDLFATDHQAAARLGAFAQGSMAGYNGLVETLPPTDRPHHGMIGLTAQADAAPVLSVGVAAPWSCVHEVH